MGESEERTSTTRSTTDQVSTTAIASTSAQPMERSAHSSWTTTDQNPEARQDPKQIWHAKRAALIQDVFGGGVGKLPGRSIPDIVRAAAAPGVKEIVWKVSGRHQVNSTVFHAPRRFHSVSDKALIWHQG